MRSRVRPVKRRPESPQQQWDRRVWRRTGWLLLRDCLVTLVILAVLATILVPRIIA